LSRGTIIAVAAAVAVIGFVVFLQTRPPSGVAPMGPEASSIVPWVSLATAVAGLLTALTNLALALRKPRA
jgi:uncharacterized membrane protein